MRFRLTVNLIFGRATFQELSIYAMWQVASELDTAALERDQYHDSYDQDILENPSLLGGDPRTQPMNIPLPLRKLGLIQC